MNRFHFVALIARWPRLLGCGAGALLVCAQSFSAPASLDALGVLPGMANSSATSVSSDGTIVIGSSSTANYSMSQAFRWTRETGMVALNSLPPGSKTGAKAISGDGRVIVGATGNGVCLWTTLGDPEILTTPAGWDSIQPGNMSSDGSVFVGTANHNNVMRAFRWSRATGFVDLGTFLPASASRTSWATGISADGNVVAGFADGNTQSGTFRWTAAGGMVYIGKLPGALDAIAYDMSDSGNEIVGFCEYFEADQRAFRWQAGSPLLDLGNFPGGSFYNPQAISGDGNVIVGTSITAQGYRITRWTSTTGTQNLYKYLPTVGVDMTQWPPLGAAGANLSLYDVNVDGRVMVGDGYKNGVRQAIVIQLPTVFRVCPSDLNEDGVVDDADFVIFVGQYTLLVCSTAAMPTCPADLNADGFVDDSDFVLFVQAYSALLCSEARAE